MADDGSVVIKIDGDDSGFQQSLEGISGSAEIIAAGLSSALDTAASELTEKMAAAGESAGLCLAQGIAAASETIGASVRESAGIVVEALGDSLSGDIMAGIAGAAFAGILSGVQSGADSVKSAVQNAGAELTEETVRAAETTVDGYAAALGLMTQKTAEIMDAARTAALSALAPLPGEFQTVGYEMVSGMISGLYSRSGALYGAISGIVETAVSRARSAAAVASPSKKTREIFRYVGEGMIEGLNDTADDVADTAQAVVDNALDLDTAGIPDITPASGAAALGIRESVLSEMGVVSGTVSTSALPSVSGGGSYDDGTLLNEIRRLRETVKEGSVVVMDRRTVGRIVTDEQDRAARAAGR